MKNIIARITIEILGSPKEHIEQTMKEVIKKLNEEKNVKVLKKEVYECQQMENKLWNTFADIELETPELKRIQDICYDYMPSTIEILEPAGLEIDCNEFADLLNDILTKLHKHNVVLQKLKTENIFLVKELEKHKQ
jgi:hypothetical protein